MIVLDWCDQGGADIGRRFVLIFGLGLIGKNVLDAVFHKTHCNAHFFPFDWGKNAREDASHIVSFLNSHANKQSVDIVWSAGKFGFGSPRICFDPEIESFKLILELCQRIAEADLRLEVNFHHLSSAGGLYEGQVQVSKDTLPRPLRPYGEVKMLQEELVAGVPGLTTVSIYRPSSVYGFGGLSSRRGLIDSLIFNATNNNVTTISGGPDTLRDYIFVRDIGSFIARRIVSKIKGNGVFFLASGKPTSVIEVMASVELIMDRRLLRRYDRSGVNSSNMSFRHEVLPEHWQPTALATGIRESVSMVKAEIEYNYLNVQKLLAR